MWPNFPTARWDVHVCVTHFDHPKGHWKKSIERCNFVHAVQLVLPGSYRLPDYLRQLMSEREYQVVRKLPAEELLSWDFLEAFVRRGKLSALSVGTSLSTGNCVAVTPEGKLHLSLQEDVFRGMGIEGTLSATSSKSHKTYEAKVDLLQEWLYPGKSGYDRLLAALKRAGENLVCDMALCWEPPQGETASPFSPGDFLRKRGFAVDHCRPSYSFSQEFSLTVPKMEDQLGRADDASLLEVHEWLGAVVCNVDTRPAEDEFVSSYHCPEPSEDVGQLFVAQWLGFFPGVCLEQLLSKLRERLADEGMPFCGVVAHGFDDDPTRRRTGQMSLLLWPSTETSFLLLPDGKLCLFRSPNIG